jgi:predicted O-methyltransferase YrrM
VTQVSRSKDESVERAALPARLRWAAGAARLILREPGDGLDRALGRARRLATRGVALRHEYEPDAEWERHLHERLNQPWPCKETHEFEMLWSQVTRSLEQQGLPMGRGTYGGWDDGDRGLARTVWCLTRHLSAASVVETGVARGITSRVILEALERNGSGRLCSIDLPALDTAIHSEIGAAVPSDLRARWMYLNGTSRRRLPPLLDELGEIDLFVHDSSHTTRNLHFELERAWSALRRGAVVADDIERNEAFGDFTRARPDIRSFVAAADDSGALFGIALKGL